MHIAVVGAGFSGLALTWYLLHAFPSSSIKVIDRRSLGKGTSGLAAGLLHPFAGAHAKLNARGYEGMKATSQLLAVAKEFSSQPVISSQKGSLRLALSSQQQIDFIQNNKLYPFENFWLEPSDCQLLAPGCAEAKGLWISSTLTVYSQNYLQGLWKACAQKGAQLEQVNLQNLEELKFFDLIILATGAEGSSLKELSFLPLTLIKGQILEFEAPFPPLKAPLNSQAYVLMTEKNKSCLVGASYERGASNFQVDLEKAKKEILPKAFSLYPPLDCKAILKCYAGVRACTSHHLPFTYQLSKKTWVLTGMGSKGLLYHALYAKELVEKIKAFY